MISKLLASSPVRIGDAAISALIGFSVVFLGIAFLILVVWAVGKIMTALEKKSKASNSKPKAIEKAEPKSAQANEDEISEETLAVITAALMAYYEANNPKCEFTVKRIKRI